MQVSYGGVVPTGAQQNVASTLTASQRNAALPNNGVNASGNRMGWVDVPGGGQAWANLDTYKDPTRQTDWTGTKKITPASSFMQSGDSIGGGGPNPAPTSPISANTMPGNSNPYAPSSQGNPWGNSQGAGSMQNYIANLLTRYGGQQAPVSSPTRNTLYGAPAQQTTSPFAGFGFTTPRSGMSNASSFTGLLDNPTFGSSMRYR